METTQSIWPGLVELLRDTHAEYGDRDDAAMELGAFDNPEVEEALAAVAADPQSDSELADPCGESLAQIWIRKGTVNPGIWERLQPAARDVAEALLKSQRPDLLAQLK